MGYKRYSDEQKAAALAAIKANGGNLFRTAHELKIPFQTLSNWAKDTREPVQGFSKLVTEKEESLAELCDKVARKYLNHASDDFVVAVTPGHLSMTAAGIAVDKAQLLRGQPTSITENSHSDSSQFQTLIKRIRPDLSNDTIDLLMRESLERIQGDSDKLIG